MIKEEDADSENGKTKYDKSNAANITRLIDMDKTKAEPFTSPKHSQIEKVNDYSETLKASKHKKNLQVANKSRQLAMMISDLKTNSDSLERHSTTPEGDSQVQVGVDGGGMSLNVTQNFYEDTHADNTSACRLLEKESQQSDAGLPVLTRKNTAKIKTIEII